QNAERSTELAGQREADIVDPADQTVVVRQWRHYLVAGEAEQLANSDKAEPPRAQLVDALRKRLYGLAAIAPRIVEQNDVAALRRCVFDGAADNLGRSGLLPVGRVD